MAVNRLVSYMLLDDIAFPSIHTVMLNKLLPAHSPTEHWVSVDAPGKLIISGEHAVLYGAPAIACAINRYTQTTVKKSHTWHDRMLLSSLNIKKSIPYHLMKSIEQDFLSKHESYRLGKALIKDVLKEPLDLSIYTAAKILKAINKPITYGLDIQTTSSIPISCGMGSSAANIVSLLSALHNMLQLDVNEDSMFELARQAESLQHGQSSGLDIHLSMFGGCIKFEQGRVSKLPILDKTFQVISTGKPKTTTGECVEHVKSQFQQQSLIEAFRQTSMQIEHALVNDDSHNLKKYIKINQKLLTQIGIVPLKIQKMVTELAQYDCAAKICGAGAVSGENAGVLLVIGCEQSIEKVAHSHGYQVETLEIAATGVVNSKE